MIAHNEAAKITELVKSSDLMEPNVLLAQPLMKNGGLKHWQKKLWKRNMHVSWAQKYIQNSEAGRVLWSSNESSGVKNPPKTLFEIKIVLSKQK